MNQADQLDALAIFDEAVEGSATGIRHSVEMRKHPLEQRAVSALQRDIQALIKDAAGGRFHLVMAEAMGHPSRDQEDVELYAIGIGSHRSSGKFRQILCIFNGNQRFSLSRSYVGMRK
nr:hypothetical protein [Sphingomonas sp. CDS-1]